MNEDNPSQLKFAMNYGAILGIIMVIFAILFYIIGMDTTEARWTQWLYYVIIIGILIYAIKTFRDQYLGGAITFGKALGTGVLVVLFGSIIYAVYSYIFLTFIDASMIEKMITMAEEDMINRGMSDDQIEQGMEMTRKFMANPILMSLMLIITFTFFGFIFSLVIGLFMKKDPVDTFDQDTQEASL